MSETISALRLSQIKNELREEIRQMVAHEVATVERSLETKQLQRHSENIVTLQKIEKDSSSTNTRMNLLFNEDGDGLFKQLQSEVRKLGNKLIYATGFIAGVIALLHFLK